MRNRDFIPSLPVKVSDIIYTMLRVLLFNKPYGVLTQFPAEGDKKTLADYINLPGFYAAGRLDANSEGLLVLTDNGKLQSRISHPKHKMTKGYWVQVEGEPSAVAINQLERGVTLKDGLTNPAKVSSIAEPEIWPRTPPIRVRAQIPTHWLDVRISEGRNRQVRRMTAHVGYPTLRLIRHHVGPWQLGDLLPGESRMLELKRVP